MTSKEFVIWMKGIVAASNNYNISPATWDEIKEQLEKVKDILIEAGVDIKNPEKTIKKPSSVS